MRKFFTGCSLILFTCILQESGGQSLHIMTYNIHHGCDIHEKLQLNGIAEIIRKSKAEIVGLEEVDSVCKRSGNTDQAKILAGLTGMYYAYVRHFAFDGGSYGLALLSEFPITDVVNNRVPVLTETNGNTRALLSAVVQLPAGGQVLVAVAHLDYRSEASRIRQSKFIVNMLKDKDSPMLLLGDLNARPASLTIGNLKQLFTDAGHGRGLTFPSDKPSEKIDYILVDRSHFRKTLNGSVYNVRYSDHRPLAAYIKLSL